MCLLFFSTQIRKHRCASYTKCRPCVVSNISIVAISVGLPVAVNNPVPVSQVQFQQFRVIERFCVEGSNKRSERGHFSNDWELFNDRTFRASFSEFCELIDAFRFVPRNSVWGVLKSGLAKGLASVKSGPACSTNLYDINRKPFTKAPFKTI